jgi:hypothetical protein
MFIEISIKLFKPQRGGMECSLGHLGEAMDTCRPYGPFCASGSNFYKQVAPDGAIL